MKNLFPATFTPVDKRSAEEVRTSSLAVTEQDRFMCPVTFKTFARNTKVRQATCVCQTVSKTVDRCHRIVSFCTRIANWIVHRGV